MTEEEVRVIAREEARDAVASLSGLVLRRLQESEVRGGTATEERLRRIFGEALEQFSKPDDRKWPGAA